MKIRNERSRCDFFFYFYIFTLYLHSSFAVAVTLTWCKSTKGCSTVTREGWGGWGTPQLSEKWMYIMFPLETGVGYCTWPGSLSWCQICIFAAYSQKYGWGVNMEGVNPAWSSAASTSAPLNLSLLLFSPRTYLYIHHIFPSSTFSIEANLEINNSSQLF